MVKRNGVQFPAPVSGSPQLLVTAAPGYLVIFSGFCRHPHTNIHMHNQKLIKILKDVLVKTLNLVGDSYVFPP